MPIKNAKKLLNYRKLAILRRVSSSLTRGKIAKPSSYSQRVQILAAVSKVSNVVARSVSSLCGHGSIAASPEEIADHNAWSTPGCSSDELSVDTGKTGTTWNAMGIVAFLCID